MDDAETAAHVAAGSWETQSHLCAAHLAALQEYETANLIAYLHEDHYNEIRLLVATVALARAVGRLSR